MVYVDQQGARQQVTKDQAICTAGHDALGLNTCIAKTLKQDGSKECNTATVGVAARAALVLYSKKKKHICSV